MQVPNKTNDQPSKGNYVLSLITVIQYVYQCKVTPLEYVCNLYIIN